MPLRQTIGISLALLMASAGAMAKAPDKDTSYQPSQPPSAGPEKSASRSGKARVLHRLAHARASWKSASHRGLRARYRQTLSDTGDSDGGPPDPYSGPTRSTGSPEIGQAAWYDLVGGRTSNGERLDMVTPTAAHRSLPLGSCAKVTNLDTGRSVIVKINDRGPYSRRFIIDLSPRAADDLGMRHDGVAAVAVEPVAIVPAGSAAARPTVAVYRGPASNLTQ
jgi:rare lipoprotein A